MVSDISASDRLASPPPTSAHRMIGMLNVSFAGVMLLCGACSAFYMLMQLAVAPMSEGFQRQMQEAMKAQQKQEFDQKIAKLEEQEKAATSDAEKTQLQAERQALEQKGPPEVPIADMMAAYQDPKLIGFFAADTVTGLLLNALLFASGIGLLAARRWARKLALWVATLKMVRLVLIYGFAIAFVIPSFSKNMGEMMEKVVQQTPQRPGGPPMPQMGQTVATVYGVMMTSGAVLMMIFGAIYPAIMLWVLTRPAVKAACGELRVPRPAEST